MSGRKGDGHAALFEISLHHLAPLAVVLHEAGGIEGDGVSAAGGQGGFELRDMQVDIRIVVVQGCVNILKCLFERQRRHGRYPFTRQTIAETGRPFPARSKTGETHDARVRFHKKLSGGFLTLINLYQEGA